MRISAVAAMSENRVIGKNNTMPWHMPADLKHFKHVTFGRPIIMGRKTYQSIGRALPGRTNIVISRNPTFSAPGCVVLPSIEKALENLANAADEVFIIGGAMIYQEILPQIERIYLTVIHHHFEGDAFFPQLNATDWFEVEREDHTADEKNPYAYSFLVLDRIAKG